MPTAFRLAAALACAPFVPAFAAEKPPFNGDGKPAAEKVKPATPTAAEIDAKILAEIAGRSEQMKNLAHLSDVIGPRLTGSPGLERANRWAKEKFDAYGLTGSALEPWEIPVGWTRGTVSFKLASPAEKMLTAASAGWGVSTRGTISGPVVFLDAKTKADLEKYKGKLKDAVVMLLPPAKVAPVTDTTYGPPPAANPAPKDGKEPPKDAPKEAPKEAPKPRPSFREQMAQQREMLEMLKAEGVAAVLRDSAKPHGLLVTTGGWRDGENERHDTAPGTASLFVAHEHYALLHRLVTVHGQSPTVEIDVKNSFSSGPVTVYNTVAELRGTEKPDEIVVVGAHLDSWDLASGTTDNGTGSTLVLEVARALSELSKQGVAPKRTIRFVLFSGEEQGLHGSKQYVARHAAEMPKHSAALVHDTGTGKVLTIGVQGRAAVQAILAPQLESLKPLGFEGVTLAGMGGTDHLSFESKNVPGFALRQDMDEYRFTHHTQSDTFDKAKGPNLVQGAQVMAVAAFRIADLPDLLPRTRADDKK